MDYWSEEIFWMKKEMGLIQHDYDLLILKKYVD